MKLIFNSRNYEDMDWSELSGEAKRRKLSPRLCSLKGVEGAGERDRVEIIRQLNDLDQQGRSNKAFLISLISLAVSITSLLVSLCLK